MFSCFCGSSRITTRSARHRRKSPPAHIQLPRTSQLGRSSQHHQPPRTTATMPQQLSSKDASLFRQVVRHYETKQHKKGGFRILESPDLPSGPFTV